MKLSIQHPWYSGPHRFTDSVCGTIRFELKQNGSRQLFKGSYVQPVGEDSIETAKAKCVRVLMTKTFPHLVMMLSKQIEREDFWPTPGFGEKVKMEKLAKDFSIE